MYMVYEIFFKELNAVYVGCSSDLNNRTNQHNENARKEKSKLGKFLKDNNIILKTENLKVIATFFPEYRKKALELERSLAKAYNSTNIILLNDNYSKTCSRKGKANNQKFPSKDWAIVDFQEQKVVFTNSLRKWAFENNVCYKELHATHKNTPHSYLNRYTVFHKEVWETFNEETKRDYLTGKFLEKIYSKNLENHIKRNAKTYIVEFPDGHEETITNLDRFAKEHNINAGNLHASITNGRKASGYKAKRPY